MTAERSELILRVPGLTREQADKLAAKLAPLARKTGGKLSRIDRERHSDHERHLRREKIV
jgi:hypothetical protein